MAICLILPGLSCSVFSLSDSADYEKKIIGSFASEIEISTQSDYYIKFSSDDLTLEGKNITVCSFGLSEKVKEAIAKSPRWIQRELARQFKEIDSEGYADLILGMSKKYVDEIAFSIACCPVGRVPSVEVIRDNVLTLYENDLWIKYADIVDYDDNFGNYYSTISYRVIEEGIEKQLEYPKEIYYWNVVHPDVISIAESIYGKFWRDYLFNHNDIGYPLLKEKLSEIEYLWDCKSYSPPSQRLWEWSMVNHPTAVEAIGYWIGKTVPNQAFGDRPGQPNIIAHEHNGWCGELMILAVAAQSAALVPSVSNNNIGEDHVWRQFYERGWHQIDNWWSDGGGAVDVPDVYAYGWGKDISAIYAKKGDSSIYEVTSTYIHPEDRKTVCFQVLDRSLHPVDGARIVVAVKGPKDITWIKYKLLEKVNGLWDKIPPLFKGKILQNIYNKITEKIAGIPDGVDGPINTIWNYTDINGKSCFELGQNRSYIFFVQYGNLESPLMIASYNKLRVLQDPIDKNYFILFWLLSPLKDKHSNKEMPTGDVDFKVSFDTKYIQLQKSIAGNYTGIYSGEGSIDFFIVDEDNFTRYNNGESFICYNYLSNSKSDIFVNAQQKNWYLVFRNNARSSNVIVNFSVSVEMNTTEDKVKIVSPDTNIFDIPMFNIGDTVVISGVATNDIVLNIGGVQYDVTIQDHKWSYELDTSSFLPGDYLIKAECGDAQDEILIKLIDVIPPIIRIDSPFDGEIVETDMLTIQGHASDNLGVEKVEVAIDKGDWREATGTDLWTIDWDISDFSISNHIVSARTFDAAGGVFYDYITITLNESGHIWSPIINGFYSQPDHPINTSNVVIYANVTEGGPFPIKKVVIFWDDGSVIKSKEMYRYGDNPAQARHEEDPLKNMSNDPIYGFELGQFSTGENIAYWIQAFDSAENSVISSSKSFTIENI